MKRLKQLFVAFLFFGFFALQSSDVNLDEKFPQESTEEFEYLKIIEEKTVLKDTENQEPIVSYDTTSQHYFDTGITRKKITIEIKDGKSITTTETWITKKPSYLTKMNIAAVSTIIGALAIQGILMNIRHDGHLGGNGTSWSESNEYKDTTFFDWLLNSDKYKEADLVAHYNYFKHSRLCPFYHTQGRDDSAKRVNEWLRNNEKSFVSKFGQQEYDKQFLINDLVQKVEMVKRPDRSNPSYHPAELKAFLEQNAERNTQLLGDDYQWKEYLQEVVNPRHQYGIYQRKNGKYQW